MRTERGDSSAIDSYKGKVKLEELAGSRWRHGGWALGNSCKGLGDMLAKGIGNAVESQKSIRHGAVSAPDFSFHALFTGFHPIYEMAKGDLRLRLGLPPTPRRRSSCTLDTRHAPTAREQRCWNGWLQTEKRSNLVC